MGKIEGKIERGKKWFEILEKATFREQKKKVDWINSQKNILEEIDFYKKSLEPEEEVKSKGKK